MVVILAWEGEGQCPRSMGGIGVPEIGVRHFTCWRRKRVQREADLIGVIVAIMAQIKNKLLHALRTGRPGRAIGTIALIALLALLWGCEEKPPPSAEAHSALPMLRVAVLQNPVFFEQGSEKVLASGFEYDLVSAFAKAQNKEPRFVVVERMDALFDAVQTGAADLAVGVPVGVSADLSLTTPLYESPQIIVQQAGGLPRDAPEDLVGQTIEITPSSPVQAGLAALNPPALAQVSVAMNGVDLLARVSEGKTLLVATDRLHFDVALNFYPDLEIAQELPAKTAYAWAFAPHRSALHAQAQAFIAQVRKDGQLERWKERHFGHIQRVNPREMRAFLVRARERLPAYRAMFHEAQILTGIDWRLLAALAYQESQWDPLATSYTGVRGMMMLTEDTADHLKVSNRLDARESILAGSRYFEQLTDQVGQKVPLPDRYWLALSAYNLGPGHFNGARAIARSLKKKPGQLAGYEKSLAPVITRGLLQSAQKWSRARRRSGHHDGKHS